MNIKLQLVVLGLIVSQGLCLTAMDKDTNSPRVVLSVSAEAKKAVKHAVEEGKVAIGIKRQCTHLSVPKYLEAEGRDWPTELKKNPSLAWLPI